MSAATDPALYNSDFERIEGDRYWTEPWLTSALLRVLRRQDMTIGRVWEPAAGRGDIVSVLLANIFDVLASDNDMSEFDEDLCECLMHDFLLANDLDTEALDIDAVITNPPYMKIPGTRLTKAEAFVRRALSLPRVRTVAMLLRSEFSLAGRRVDLFEDQPFAFEVRLTSRPRWDWWFRDEPDNGPRHHFSWFVWNRDWQGPPTIFWEGRKARRRK